MENQELLRELHVIDLLVRENPCRMSDNIMAGIAKGIRFIIGSHVSGGASREQAARYLKRDVRTLSRWAELYDDFPNARHDGQKSINYDWMELIRFKLNHRELYSQIE